MNELGSSSLVSQDAPMLDMPSAGAAPRPDFERRVAAIMFADVVGYSRMVGLDDEGTIAALRLHRQQLVDPLIVMHRGRVVRTLGDGLLVEFGDAVDAVECAVDIQRGMAERQPPNPGTTSIILRMGIGYGGIIAADGEIHGDIVNIAARLQELAEPGGVCVTDAVRDRMADRETPAFLDLGEPALKNIVHPVRVFAIDGLSGLSTGARPGTRTASRPSIAVLPFENISGDPAQNYFADGMTEEITTSLSRIRWMFVIARNSAFNYRGRGVDLHRVAEDLGVRYVLRGSIRRAKQRLRITARLVDAQSGTELWADSFDADMAQIFALQDRIAGSVAGAIEPRLRAAEIEHARRKPTESLTAYDYFLRALPHRAATTAEDNRVALRLLRCAIASDHRLAPALAHASMCITAMRNLGWEEVHDDQITESILLAEAALGVDGDDPVALTFAGHTIAAQTGDYQRGLSLIERALQINPNSAEAWARGAMVRVYLGDLETAIVHAQRSIELSPRDPNLYMPHCAMAYAHLFAGRYDSASTCARDVLGRFQKVEMAYRILIASAALAGRDAEARAVAAELLQRRPNFRVSQWSGQDAFRRAEQIDIMTSGLRKAGMPE